MFEFWKKKTPPSAKEISSAEDGEIPATDSVTSRAMPDENIEDEPEPINTGKRPYIRRKPWQPRQPRAVSNEPRLPTSEQAEALQAEADHARNHPVVFPALARDEGAAEKLFQGLHQHYIECLMTGRLDVWAAAAHKIIDLLADARTKIHERAA